MSGCWEARELVIGAWFGKSTRGIRAGSTAHRIPGFTEPLAKFPHQYPSALSRHNCLELRMPDNMSHDVILPTVTVVPRQTSLV
jgi:hypothetical protein